MTDGIGYTVLVNEYALMTVGERQIDERRWPLTDNGEQQAVAAAKAEAAKRHVHYAGELR